MNRKVGIFVFNASDCKLVKSLATSRKIDSRRSIIILFSKYLEEYFNLSDIKYIFYDTYLKNTDFANESIKILNLVKSFPHEKLLFNKSLVELLEYDGFSLWWFVRQGFYGHCLEIVKKITTIRHIIKNQEIKEIILLNPDETTVELFRQCTNKVKIKIIRKREIRKLFKYYLASDAYRSFLKYFSRMIRFSQGLLRSHSFPQEGKKKNILVFTHSHTWTRLKENVEGDPNTYSVIKELNNSKKFNLLLLDLAIDTKSSWKAIKKKKKPFLPYDYFLMKTYFNLSVNRKLNNHKSKLKELWHKLNGKSAIKKILVVDGIFLYPLLRSKLQDYFLRNFGSFTGAARNIEAGKGIISKYNIDHLILIDENGTSRFLVYAGKMRNIFSLGIQHGIITSNLSISYNYSKKDLLGYSNKLNCQLADNTAVFGKYFKDILIKQGNYPHNNPVVTGQPRTDILYENKNIYSKEKLYSNLGIDSKKKLVIFASQPFSDINESKTTLSTVIHSLRNFPEIELIIKLHPNDSKSNYIKILNEHNYNAIILQDFDIYWLIYCCEFLMAISSTVLFEALIMNKPAVQLNLISDYKLLDKDLKALIKVHNEKELNSCITNLLGNERFASKISKETSEFISQYFYKVDGHSTKRIIKIIEGQE